MCLSLHQYHIILLHNSQNEVGWFLSFYSFFKNGFSYCSSFSFLYKFLNNLFYNYKNNLGGIVIGIALNLYINNQLTHNYLQITEILTEDRAAI